MTTCRPLYKIYSGQVQPQRAYVTLDENNNVTFDWAGEIGNSYPASVYNGLDHRWRVCETLTQQEIDELKEKLQPYFDIIIANSEIVFNNNWTRKLNEVAQQASEYIEKICDEFYSENTECCNDLYCDLCGEELMNEKVEE